MRDPERVWAAVLLSELRIPLYKAPSRILKLAARPEDCRWLPGAALNIAWAALHAPRAGPAGDGAAAVAWAEDGHPSEVQSITRKQLCVVALHVAACLRKQGLKPGTVVYATHTHTHTWKGTHITHTHDARSTECKRPTVCVYVCVCVHVCV